MKKLFQLLVICTYQYSYSQEMVTIDGELTEYAKRELFIIEMNEGNSDKVHYTIEDDNFKIGRAHV